MESKVVELRRGQIIQKKEKDDFNQYPVYSSSVVNDGLMGFHDSYMFEEELISWSIDGGGDFFYRRPHRFNITNVSGALLLDRKKYSYRFVAEALIFQHSHLAFDYQTKAHPSVIQDLYSLPIIDIEIQKRHALMFDVLYRMVENNVALLSCLKKEKEFLLHQLFI